MRFQAADLELDILLSTLCRDERCARTDIHAKHAIRETPRQRAQRRRTLGWVSDPLEPMEPRERKEPVELLEECVLEVTSSVIPKSMGMIQRDLTNVYGHCGDRRLYRCLDRMAVKRRNLRVDLSKFHNGGDLRADLHLGSRLADDPLLIYEQFTDYFASSAFDHEQRELERREKDDFERALRHCRTFDRRAA